MQKLVTPMIYTKFLLFFTQQQVFSEVVLRDELQQRAPVGQIHERVRDQQEQRRHLDRHGAGDIVSAQRE